MPSLLPDRRTVNGGKMLHDTIDEIHAYLGRLMSQRLNLRLSAAVDHLLGRGRYDRRAAVPDAWEQSGRGQRCGSHRCDHFSRNGHRLRTLGLLDYVLSLALPRVVCQCGGSVQLDFAGLLRPYQRLGAAIDAQIQRWGAMSISLREVQAELAHSAVGPLGLRTINERLHQLQELTPDLAADQVPPILQIDAIWYTQLLPTGETRPDSQGRQRAVKKGQKRPILIAMGMWPETGRREILAWEVGQSEDAAAWVHFLGRLEEQGLRGANGLKLVIHDGGSGLCAALQTVDLDAAEQRCLFHKTQKHWCSPHLRGAALTAAKAPAAPQNPPRLSGHLARQGVWHRSAPLLARRPPVPQHPTQGRRHLTPRFPQHADLLPDSERTPDLAAILVAGHQSPRTFQSSLTPAHPHRQRLSF
jgi:hypothetical protein